MHPRTIRIDKFDRFQLLHRLLRSHKRPVPIGTLATRLECTERSVKRIIDQMRNFLDAPIAYFPDAKGWHYTDDDKQFELPGLWLTSSELQSLAMLLHLLEQIGEGLLGEELSVVDKQLHKLLNARDISPAVFEERIRILPLATRYVPSHIFSVVGEALLKRTRLDIRYRSYTNELTRRSISPQTLVYYRDNWYLDAWCHLRKDLRTFSLARIELAVKHDGSALDIEPEQLLQHFAQSYGMFGGKPKRVAKLRFSPSVAREIAMQQWHPDQIGEWDGNDYLLQIPYSDDRELTQDILRYIPNVLVESPATLKKVVLNRLHAGLELYAGKRIRRP